MAAPRASSRREHRHWDIGWLIVALGVVAWIFHRNTMLMSRVIDGARWFVLDDDMMISMRYGRNLAEGHGLVWNEGERVEGYTNFLWTLLMAAVHALGAEDRTASVWIKVCGYACLAGTLVQTVRLVRLFAPRSFAVTPLVLASTVMSIDVTLFASWGFETSLVALLVVTFFVALLEGSRRPWGWIALALTPLARSDGIHLFLTGAIAALALADDRRACARRLLLCLAPCAVHLLFRRAYYGEWLPNTYYLKVHLLDQRLARGVGYVRGFALAYAVSLVLASTSALAIARRERRALVFFVVLGGTLAYLCSVGGDMMKSWRFCAHVVPLVYAFAAVGIVRVAQQPLARLAWGATLFLVSVPILDPIEHLVALDQNGDPQEQLQVAALVKKNALPTSSIGVIAAGIVPYFTRLRAIALLGKSDAHLARLAPFPGAMVGHGKVDPDYSFVERRPDLVVSCRGQDWAQRLTTNTRVADPVLTLLAADAFQKLYRPYPIQNRFLLGATAVYTYAGSPEAQQRSWAPIDVGSRPAPANASSPSVLGGAGPTP